jgi:hypothetical protein
VAAKNSFAGEKIRSCLGGNIMVLAKKQNPAFGGICCSQLVLVTQTLPKEIEVSCPSKLFIECLPGSLFGRPASSFFQTGTVQIHWLVHPPVL